MDTFDWQAIVRLIIYVSWPGLVLGTAVAAREALRFRRTIRNRSCGRLVTAMTAGWLVALYCLGFVATAHLLRHGTKDDVLSMAGIFLVSVFVFLGLLAGLRRWNREAVELNGLYARFEEAAPDRTTDLETQHRRCEELIVKLRDAADERASALRSKLEEIDEITRLMVLRETRMAELKLQIAALKAPQVVPSRVTADS
jgi:hypothetical protein